MGSMALQLKPFTVPDPLETYGRAMSLRALMDERRYRALREQQAQQKILEDQEERQQARNLRQLFSTNPNPTMQQILSVAPSGVGLRAATEVRQAQTAEEQQKTAALTRQKTFRDVQQGFREEYLNAVTAIARDKDPARRAAIYPQIQQRLRQAAGDYLTPDLDAFISQELPDDEDEILTVYAAVKGPEKLEELLKNRAAETRAKAEEARKVAGETRAEAAETRAQQTHIAQLPGTQAKASGEQYEFASRFAPNVKDQATYDALLAMLPEAERKKWPATYSPGAVQMIERAGMTAAQRATAERQAVPNTAFEAAYAATDPNLPPEERAKQALKTMERHALLSRPQINLTALGNPAEWANRIQAGEMTISQVPDRARGAVVDELGRRNVQIINPKQREAVADLDVMSTRVDDLEKRALAVNKKYGLSALAGGALQRAMAAMQNDPDAQALQRALADLGNYARALGGERGVLTEGDVARSMSRIPQLGDSDKVTIDKIKDLRDLITAKRNAIFGQHAVYERGATQPVGTPPPARKEQKLTTPPPIGTVKNGYWYAGGDPSDRKNWKQLPPAKVK